MAKKKKIIADSNIIIDAFRGNKTAKNKLANPLYDIYLSDITVMELFIGCNTIEKRKNLENQLEYFGKATVNSEVIQKTMSLIKRYSNQKKLFLPDIFIAGCAYHYKLPLLTNNKRHFSFIKEITLI